MASIQYEITNISTGMGLNDAGQLVEQVVVHYRTMHNDTGVIRMEKSMYSAEGMKSLIEAEINEHAKLRGV